MQRAQQQDGEETGAFFRGIRNALVLSVQGGSEAGRMSGGDYDGDRAWVSWNDDLLRCLPGHIEAEDTSCLTTRKSKLEQKLWSECCMKDSLDYMLHFRGHQRCLGKLSEVLDLCIDKFGFDDIATKAISRAAFIQVDMPYHP
jgi:RNA dependent RNA polymerase